MRSKHNDFIQSEFNLHLIYVQIADGFLATYSLSKSAYPEDIHQKDSFQSHGCLIYFDSFIIIQDICVYPSCLGKLCPAQEMMIVEIRESKGLKWYAKNKSVAR